MAKKDTNANASAPTVKQITEGALVKRINRALAKEGRRVKTTRPTYNGGNGPNYNQNLGRHRVVDIDQSDFLIEGDVDLVDLGRRLGVLKAWEYVHDEDRLDIISQIGGLDDETT